jgi:hypothetical protein
MVPPTAQYSEGTAVRVLGGGCTPVCKLVFGNLAPRERVLRGAANLWIVSDVVTHAERSCGVWRRA